MIAVDSSVLLDPFADPWRGFRPALADALGSDEVVVQRGRGRRCRPVLDTRDTVMDALARTATTLSNPSPPCAPANAAPATPARAARRAHCAISDRCACAAAMRRADHLRHRLPPVISSKGLKLIITQGLTDSDGSTLPGGPHVADHHRQHVAERAASAFPPLPLTAQQTADLIELIPRPRRRAKIPSCSDLLTRRVPARRGRRGQVWYFGPPSPMAPPSVGR